MFKAYNMTWYTYMLQNIYYTQIDTSIPSHSYPSVCGENA